MKPEPNDTIHPVDQYHIQNTEIQHVYGLTKREHFAAIAMQGLISSCDWRIRVLDDDLINTTALKSAKLADALIEALNKEKP